MAKAACLHNIRSFLLAPSWIPWIFISSKHFFFPRYPYSLTIHSQRKIIQNLQKKPPNIPYCNRMPDIARLLLLFSFFPVFELWRPSFCIMYLLLKRVEYRSGSTQPYWGPLWALATIFYICFEQFLCTVSPSFPRCGIAFIVCANFYRSSMERLRCFAHPPMWKTVRAGG